MQLIQPFNAQQYDPTQSAGSLPIGRHPVIIESSEVKANKANDGGYLQLNLRIIDGPQQGTVGAYRLNLYHTNQQTVEIAHKQLSAICHVLGVFQVTDSSQLHNLPFFVEVGPQKSDPQYTEVKKVYDMNGNEPGKAGAPAPAAAPAQAPPPQEQQPNPAFGQQAPQGAPAWGQQPPQQAPQQPPQAPTAPAWGVAPAPAPQQQQAPAWQQGGAPAAAPWGQR